jgi:hypothetical protein
MKKVFLVFASLVISSLIFAQEIVAEKQAAETAPEDFELSDVQYASWKKISNFWLADDFEKVKFENKIDVNCKSCSSVYMDVIIKINASGKLEYYKLVKGKKCGLEITKPFEMRMMRSFIKYEYPPELRNVTFKTRLGVVLKC